MLRKLTKGMNLIEVTLATVIMVIAFFPIISMFTANYKITERDKTNIVAVNLCREKLDTALQFPFESIKVGKYGFGASKTKINTATLTLDLGSFTKEGVEYNFLFEVTDRNEEDVAFFTIMPRAFEDEEFSDDDSGKPKELKFDSEKKLKYKNMVHRYKMTVGWSPKGVKNTGIGSYTYTLQTFQVNLRNE